MLRYNLLFKEHLRDGSVGKGAYLPSLMGLDLIPEIHTVEEEN